MKQEQILIVILFVVFIVGGGVAYYFFQKTPTDKSPTPTPPGGSSTWTLLITENGTTFTENYQIMPRREGYIQMPRVNKCYAPGETRPDFCNVHNRSTDGFAYAYDLNSTEWEYSECPGGGHECWYKEKFDENGHLVDMVDKNGVKLLDKLADDLWSNKWDLNRPDIKMVVDTAEYKDGKLITRIPTLRPDGTYADSGTEMTINSVYSKSVYLMILMIAMKNAGQPKPGRIVLNVAGGKADFDNFITTNNAFTSQ